MKLGLLGKNISYSFSKEFFENRFRELNLKDFSYSIFDLHNIEEIESLFRKDDLLGFNVTIPYKEEIIKYLDELDYQAESVGAVNTVKKINSKFIGFNTDVIGFRVSLEKILNKNLHKSAIILGGGGASKAVRFVLDELKIKYTVISRKTENNYKSLTREIVENNLLIINTTPLGTFPNVEEMPPFPTDFLNENHLVYDLIYNPEKTKLLKLAELKGAKIKNGLEMLHLQAEAAWNIWNKID